MAPPQPRTEWFWRDRLSMRPEPLDAPAAAAGASEAGVEERVAATFEAAADRPPGSLEPEIVLLAGLGPDAVPFIREWIDAPERTARFLAAAALGRIGGPLVQEPLLLMLRDEWSAPPVLAADCLMEIAEPWTLPRLVKTLGPYSADYNPYLMVRVKAARTLIRHGCYSGVPFLIKILKENTPAEDPLREWDEDSRMAWFKEEALAGLSALTGDTFGFGVDSPRPVQAEAALRFEKWWLDNHLRLWENAPAIEDPLLSAQIKSLVEGLSSFQVRNKDGAHYILSKLGPPVFPWLEQALDRDSFYIKFHTLGIIADIAPVAGSRSGEWADAVSRLLNDSNSAVRSQACRTLGFIGRESSIALLESVMGDPDSDVRLKAVEAVGRIGGVRASRCLEGLLATVPEGQLRVEVLAALVRSSGAHIEDLADILLDDDIARQEWALQKVIDLTGSDFDFPLAGPAEERRASARIIAGHLASTHRAGAQDE